jgi:hypothetical protein
MTISEGNLEFIEIAKQKLNNSSPVLEFLHGNTVGLM